MLNFFFLFCFAHNTYLISVTEHLISHRVRHQGKKKMEKQKIQQLTRKMVSAVVITVYSFDPVGLLACCKV